MLEKQERAENGDIDDDEEETPAPTGAAADEKPEVCWVARGTSTGVVQ